MPFLPTNLAEAKARNWLELDIIIVNGDAYVDHPSFGAAVIGRYLEAAGFRVGILPQPDWSRDEDFMALGRPRLFWHHGREHGFLGEQLYRSTQTQE